MILDDNDDATSRLKNALENKQEDGKGRRIRKRRVKYKVDTYRDPSSALQDFRAGLYDLILIDFMMAKTSNFELCNKVRQMDRNVKICYTSGIYKNYEEASKAFPDLETRCFIPKWVQMEDLVRRIDEVLIL
jgi:two-component system, OmpR family, response regulator ChvI